MNLEKQRGAQNTIKKLIVDDKEITDQTHILECFSEFYGAPFKKRKQKTLTEIKSFLRHLNIPNVSEDNQNFVRRNRKRFIRFFEKHCVL